METIQDYGETMTATIASEEQNGCVISDAQLDEVSGGYSNKAAPIFLPEQQHDRL